MNSKNMIVCAASRHLPRRPPASLRFSSSSVITTSSYPTKQSVCPPLRFWNRPFCLSNQVCFISHSFSVLKMGGAKDRQNKVDQQKKRKMAMLSWRPVSRRSSMEEAAACTQRSDVGRQFNEVHHSTSCDPDTQGESIVGMTISVASRSDSMDNESESVKESSCSVSPCEMENLSEWRDYMAASESATTEDKEGVIKESVNDLESNKDAELASEVKKHSVSVEVDASLVRFIKGKGGSTQQQIEGELGVKLIFPSSKKDNYIVIEGMSAESVTKASEKIASVIEEAVKSPRLDYSHFISLPLAIHPELVDKLENFQNSIMGHVPSSQDGDLDSDSNEYTSNDIDDEEKQSDSPTIAVKLEVQKGKERVRVRIDTTDTQSNTGQLPKLGIDRSIFIKPKTFHLTVLMLKLWNEDRVAAATKTLQKISSKVKDALDNRPVFVRLKGLECMRGSQAKARVLYAPVEELGGEGRLLRACHVIIEAYVEAGLVLEKDARQTLKLHATLMNARHRKRKKRTGRNDSFDARGLFKRYGSEEWGDYLIREAHLSQRFTFDESGYYYCCASIPFPESMQAE